MAKTTGPIFRAYALVLLALGLSGCIATGMVDRTTDTIDHSVGQARNNSILLNIVRASRYEPLYFYSVSRVSGGGLEDFKLSFPAITFGPHQAASQRNYTFGTNGLNVLDSQQTGSFDVGTLESKNFYEGMLAPLTLEEVGVLLQQGFPRELIYRLTVDSVTIYGPDMPPRRQDAANGLDVGLHRYVNDPASPSYGQFQTLFGAAMDHGLTVESFEVPGLDPAKAAGGSDSSKSDDGKSHDKSPSTHVWSRLCVDPALVKDVQSKNDATATGNECGMRPLPDLTTITQQENLGAVYQACQVSQNSPAAADVKKKGAASPDATKNGAASASATSQPNQGRGRVCAHIGDVVFAVQLNTRSLFGIYAYLGKLLRDGQDGALMGLGADVEPRSTGPLLTVLKDRGLGPCFARAQLAANYCIPAEGASNLKMAFSLLNALQAVKTAPGDLPITPAVRIEQ